jgi:FKBP-type peptidyl-prolyl cis-trans isomerase FkpA
VKVFRSGIALLVLAGLAACGSSSTAPSPIPFSQTDLRLGSGATAKAGDTLTVNYTGWLYDPSKGDFKGLQFDSSAGAQPFSFTLGAGQVIAGWDQGLVGMNVGGLRRLVIPPSLGYGSIRNGPIPPYSTLVFEIELTAIKSTT